MNTKPKRKYGNIRQGAETSAGTNDDVFNKFLPPADRPESVPHPFPASHPIPEPPSDPESRPAKTAPAQNVPRTDSKPHPDSEPRRGYLQLTNHFIYDLMPTLKPTDSVVLLYLLARTHGWRKVRVEVSLNEVANGCHISRSQSRVSLNLLHSRKLIKIVTKNGERGYILDVLVPRSESAPHTETAPRTKYVPIKDRDYKRQVVKNVEPPSEEDLAEFERNLAELKGK